MRLFGYIFISILIIGLFLYSKLLPHKNRLTGYYLKMFELFESVFNPILNLLRKFFKPTQVGNGLTVDMSHIVLIILFLIILKLLI